MNKVTDKDEIKAIMDRPENAIALKELFRQNGEGVYPDYLLMVGDTIIVYGHDA